MGDLNLPQSLLLIKTLSNNLIQFFFSTQGAFAPLNKSIYPEKLAGLNEGITYF